jgi:hypothetical protein
MGVLHSGGLISGDTLKGLCERLAQRRAGSMVLHRALWIPKGRFSGRLEGGTCSNAIRRRRAA